MTSSDNREAFVWIWLPDETTPVVAGRLQADNGNVLFNYGKSYLERVGGQPAAISIYEPELPLQAGVLSPREGLTLPGCICDAAPDAWGRRVISAGDTTTKGLEPGEFGAALERTALWIRDEYPVARH